jgi:hypothetical protein
VRSLLCQGAGEGRIDLRRLPESGRELGMDLILKRKSPV